MANLDTSMLLWGLLFGSIGMGYFLYGKKRANPVARYSGIALMVYPYFVSSTVALVAIGVVLMLLPKYIKM